MIYRKQDSMPFEIPGGTAGRIYPSDEDIDRTVAYVEMDGMYPEKGFSINETCTETLYIIEGEMVVRIGDERSRVAAGDLVVIKPGNKYRVEGKGKVMDLITPRWDSAQNRIIGD